MYILNAAEAAGIDLPATCRGGICGCAAQAGSAHCAAAHTPLR
jgi:ferredoxin